MKMCECLITQLHIVYIYKKHKGYNKKENMGSN